MRYKHPESKIGWTQYGDSLGGDLPARLALGSQVIVAKHRSGPTKTITVAHQLHLSRFTNMAH